jgi:hypothetical protein
VNLGTVTETSRPEGGWLHTKSAELFE